MFYCVCIKMYIYALSTKFDKIRAYSTFFRIAPRGRIYTVVTLTVTSHPSA
nr:MAG TPA: hypothetical protein [Caudoviricetes sp.]